MSQLIYKNGCWTCKKARADPQPEYVCPQERQHWIDYQKELEWKN